MPIQTSSQSQVPIVRNRQNIRMLPLIALIIVVSALSILSFLYMNKTLNIETVSQDSASVRSKLVQVDKLLAEKDKIIDQQMEFIQMKDDFIQQQEKLILEKEEFLKRLSESLTLKEQQLHDFEPNLNHTTIASSTISTASTVHNNNNNNNNLNNIHDDKNTDTKPNQPLFNTINPHPNFCPYATCHNSPLCQPCSRRFIIEIASARSGSTTVMEMLNRLPNVRIAGENGGQLLYLLRAIDNLQTGSFSEYFQYNDHQYENGGAWYHNAIPKQSLACPVQQFMETINPPFYSDIDNIGTNNDHDINTIIGFKTIRYHLTDTFSDITTDRLCNFLIEHFPCAKFIFNYRSNIKAQTKSINKFFEQDTKQSIETIRDGETRLKEVANCLGSERAMVLDMTQWAGRKEEGQEYGVDVFNNMAKFLGFENCHYPFVVHENGGKWGFAPDERKDMLKFSEDCQAPKSSTG